MTEPAGPATATDAFNPYPDHAPQQAAKETAPKVRWLTDKKRIDTVALDFPFELDGVEYRTITVRRLTAAEVAAFVARMQANPAGEHRFPLYYAEDGTEMPDAAWNALDDDDRFRLTEAGQDFLPARFRVQPSEIPASGSSPASGDTSGSSSAT